MAQRAARCDRPLRPRWAGVPNSDLAPILPLSSRDISAARHEGWRAHRILDRWQSRVIAALRVQGRARTDSSKARGVNGVPRPTRGSNPFGRGFLFWPAEGEVLQLRMTMLANGIEGRMSVQPWSASSDSSTAHRLRCIPWWGPRWLGSRGCSPCARRATGSGSDLCRIRSRGSAR